MKKHMIHRTPFTYIGSWELGAIPFKTLFPRLFFFTMRKLSGK